MGIFFVEHYVQLKTATVYYLTLPLPHTPFLFQAVVISELRKSRLCQMMEDSELDVQIGQNKAQPQTSNNRPKWSNGMVFFGPVEVHLYNTELS